MSETLEPNQEQEPKREMTSQAVLDLYKELEKRGIQIWVDGGWGVDALLEEQTRPHKDLDIAIEEQNLVIFRELLKSKGYQEVRPEEGRPWNFVLGDGQGHEIDVHVVVLDDKSNGIYGPKENGEMYPASSLTGMGKIEGQIVKCISPEDMVKFHNQGYKIKESDIHDVTLLCKKFDISLPEEYAKLVNQE